MDHGKVLRRAWHTVWNYRALWVFGFILALTTGGGGGGGGGGSGTGNWAQYSIERIPPGTGGMLLAVGIVLACLIVLLIIVAAIARYVVETALIRLVDEHEETGQKRSVRQGFRMGWSRSAFRLFLIDLAVGLPTAVVFILLFALALAPLLLWATDVKAVGVIGTVITVGLFIVVILLAIVVALILSVLKPFFRRVCVLQHLGVVESIRQGYAMVRQNLKDVGLMWLITFGLRIGWAILMIPVVLLLLVVSGGVGGVLALLAGGLTGLAFEGAMPWIAAFVVGIPIFILLLVVPLSLLGALFEVFMSSTWTLTYRELHAEAVPTA
jgi:hypothetical protein